jgi:hypothetical protein
MRALRKKRSADAPRKRPNVGPRKTSVSLLSAKPPRGAKPRRTADAWQMRRPVANLMSRRGVAPSPPKMHP